MGLDLGFEELRRLGGKVILEVEVEDGMVFALLLRIMDGWMSCAFEHP